MSFNPNETLDPWAHLRCKRCGKVHVERSYCHPDEKPAPKAAPKSKEDLDREQAARQGAMVLEVTGKMPCSILMEHAEMLGYLRQMGTREPQVAEFAQKFKGATS